MVTPIIPHLLARTPIGTIVTAGDGGSFLMAPASPSEFRQYELAPTIAAPWVLESLSRGPSLSLAKAVARTVNLSSLSYFTLAASNLTAQELGAFEVGGKSDSRAADRWLRASLETVLVPRLPDVFTVVEDWRAQRGDPFLKEFPVTYLNQEVYYVLSGLEQLSPDVQKRVFSNTVPSFHAFVIACEAKSAANSDFTAEAIERYASGLVAIVCGIYDGESYLLAR